jgi:hypothetical protein
VQLCRLLCAVCVSASHTHTTHKHTHDHTHYHTHTTEPQHTGTKGAPGATPGQGLGNAVPQWRPGTPGPTGQTPWPRAGAMHSLTHSLSLSLTHTHVFVA